MNPWEKINLNDYEEHMKQDSIMQLQKLNEMMYDQFYRYNLNTVLILGIAGGNGLNHIRADAFKKVYGVDINLKYLEKCRERFFNLKNIFVPIRANLPRESFKLEYADIYIANLFIEYIGCNAFKAIIEKNSPKYVSVIIQKELGKDFISNSPYLHVFKKLNKIHEKIDEKELNDAMQQSGYSMIYSLKENLLNEKEFLRMDFIKKQNS